jgi:hypothetical protein
VAATSYCENCRRANPVELRMTTRDGRVLTMASCPRCESRQWTADGRPVSVAEVLQITAADPDLLIASSAGRARRR